MRKNVSLYQAVCAYLSREPSQKCHASELFDAMKKKGLLIRNMDTEDLVDHLLKFGWCTYDTRKEMVSLVLESDWLRREAGILENVLKNYPRQVMSLARAQEVLRKEYSSVIVKEVVALSSAVVALAKYSIIYFSESDCIYLESV